MKLLIITQKVDKNDPILGFFHRWIIEFAKHADHISVICLEQGEYDLPKNVTVYSLGKELSADLRGLARGLARTKYLIQFYRHIWSLRNNYDTVFVHMNQEYVLLGAPLWKLLRKKITMWRNHHFGTIFTRIAVFCSDVVFCTSKYSFTAQFKKTVFMPVGIDTDYFHRDKSIERKNKSVLFLARMSPVKKPQLVMESLHRLNETGTDFTADFYGDSLSKDAPYLASLKEKVKEYALGDCVAFKNSIPNHETPHVYARHDIFINASPSGMYDKTIFEAMACESLVLTSNLNLKGQVDDMFIFKENNDEDLSRKLKSLLELDIEVKEKYGTILRTHVIDQQSLTLLARTLFKHLTL
ncbi:MAG: glycosyltransferase family 4 protein [bacterium]|nr:glycosyltransferase family 4 protein [bacterium]